MTTDAVRSLIREVLAEELGRLRKKPVTSRTGSGRNSKPLPAEEIVSITSDEDLQSLVQHILKISRNKSMHDKISRGDYVFRLGNKPDHLSGGQKSNAVPTSTQNRNGVVQIQDGFLSERKIEMLPQGTRVVQLGQGVRFTPLARDRLRQRKIAVERIK